MNTAKDQRTDEERAKSLRLRDSGVFRRLHGGRELVAIGAAPDLNNAPAQCGQPRDISTSNFDRAVPRLLDNSLRADGLASVDAAAACNKQRQHVDEWRKPGGTKVVSGPDLMKVCRISGSLRAAVRDLLDQMETRER